MPEQHPTGEAIDSAQNFNPALGSLVNSDRLAPWVWVFLYTAVLSSLSAIRYQAWFATGWDLGLYQQGLWAIWHHGLLASSSLTGLPIVAESGSLILWLLAPLYHFGGTGFLFALQSFSLGLGYLGLVRIGEDLEVPARTRHVVGLIYLIYPALLAANVDDFHPVTLAVPLLFAAVHLGLSKRWIGYGLVVLLTLAVNEVAGLAVIGLGLGLAFGWSDIRRIVGALTALAGIIWLILITGVILPHWTHQSFWLPYYQAFGLTSHLATATLSKRPWEVFHWLKSTRSLEYVAFIFGPVIGLFLFKSKWSAWFWLLGALFIVELNGLSSNAGQTDPFDQYSVLAIPAIFVALLAIVQHVEWKTAWRFRWRSLIPVLFLLVTMYHLHETTWHSAPSNTVELVAAQALVPKGAPIVAQNYIMPHFSNRNQLLDTNELGSIPLKVGTYVLLDSEFTTGNTSASLLASWTAHLTKNQKVVYQYKGVTAIRIIHPVAKGAIASHG